MGKKARVATIEAEPDETPSAPSMLDIRIEEPEPLDAQWDQPLPELPAPRRWPLILGAVVSIMLVAGWSAVVVLANPAILSGTAPLGQWIVWVRDWSLPVLLLAALWLMALHSSRQEAIRLARSARALGEETVALEARLITINRELSLAREFLAAQSRDLDALGRVAGDRLAQHGARLAELIADNGQRAETIGEVSAAALDNMEKLRDQLPVIANSARDVTNTIAAAGRTAHAQIEGLITGFDRLNEFGLASERQIGGLRTTIDEALAAFAERTERLERSARETFASLNEHGVEFDTRLENRHSEALIAIRARASALDQEIEAAREALAANEAAGLAALQARVEAIREQSGTLAGELRAAEEEMAEQARRFERDLGIRREGFDTSHREFVAELTAQLDAFDARMAEHRSTQAVHAAALGQSTDGLLVAMTEVTQALTQAAARGDEAGTQLAAGLSAMADKLERSHEALASTERAITSLVDGSVRLLELIQASADHSTSRLPEAIAAGDARLAEIEARIEALGTGIARAADGGAVLDTHIDKAGRELTRVIEQIARLEARIAEQTGANRENLVAMEQSLASVREESLALAETAQEELRKAIVELNGSARAAVGGIEGMGVAAISSLAAKLSEESGAAIDKVMRARAAEVAGQLEEAAARAAAVGRDSAIQLRDQLAKVSELTAHLETRVAHARAKAEEQVDNDFSRRVALITESLNSNAIDIAKVMDADIADTAWAAYLKGDRGVFTRRAARLFDGPQAKAVMQLFTTDPTFRELVSRYVHDFEGMLRQVLSTRDGNAVGVTLLSSDMGKLYVALAQAIERLRE